MRPLVLTSLAVTSLAVALIAMSGASAASPEETYLAARDRYVATFKDKKFDDDKDFDEHKRALAELEAQLRTAIGSTDIKGFSKDGKIHLDTLIPSDEGFGRIDGLVYSTADDKAQVLATTESLFAKWLRAHRDWWEKNPLPADVRAALKRDDFYTQALSTDAAVVTYGEIPLAKPAQAKLAFATLAARTQDAPPLAPDELIVFVMQAGKVFVATAKATTAPIAACEKVHQKAQERADRASAAYESSSRKNGALHERVSQLEREAEWAYPHCFATRVRQASFFPALVKQAQALVDALPR